MKSSILIVKDSQGIRRILLDSDVYVMGRDAKCDIRLASQFVSKHHATLVKLPKDDGSFCYRIVDGNLSGKSSANGFLINGRKLQAHDLENEDEIIFGPQTRAIYHQLEQDTGSNGPLGSGFPVGPYPNAPECGAEATPDDGLSYIS